MTAFTINAGGTTNWDSLSGGSTNATLDSYAISNNTTLLIDTDSYQCANHSAAFGSVDTVTFSGIGGKLKATAANVRVIPYNTGTGNVPAIGATISQGGVSGTLLGVWASWLVEPTAAASAMPATGYIKIKNKTGGNYAAGALTGIGASATGADVGGWIEIRGADTAQITVPRIGEVEFGEGEFFEIGTTNGARGQIIPFPTCATDAGTFPGFWVETASGSGVYDRYVSCGSMANLSTNPTDEHRGKFLWHTTTGARIGSDGTNNVGYLPPSGCRVLIPAVILTTCTRTAGSGSGPRVLPNATLATRQEFVTTNAGKFTLNGAAMQWYGNFNQAYQADVLNSALSDVLSLQEIATPINVDNVIVSPTQAQINVAMAMTSCFAGGLMKDSLFARFSLATASICVSSNNKSVVHDNVTATTLLNRSASTVAWNVTQDVDCEWNGCTTIGGNVHVAALQRCTISNLHYADVFSGTTGTSNALYAVNLQTGCSGCVVDGVDLLGLTNVHPYSGMVQQTGCYNWIVRNIGSTSAALDFGSANACGLIINSGGNNDGGKIQRCYANNTRTGPWTFTNSDNNITLENVGGDYADTSAIISLNTIAKGVRLTGATTGQSSVYGSIWKDSFTSATVGKIEILCNEPTALSGSQCTITAGTPRFNSSGQVALTTVGDEVTWEMPYFSIGHNATANLAPTLTGTNTGNLTLEFQYDLGSGYNGSWLTFSQANWYAVGAITPATGIRLKVRAICATANTGNLLTQIAIPTVTSATDQNLEYPLDVLPISVTVKNSDSLAAIENAHVYVFKVSDKSVLLNGSTNVSGVTSATADVSPGTEIGGWVRQMDLSGTDYEQRSISGTITASGFDTTVLLTPI